VIRRTTITRRSGSGLPRLHGTKRLCRGSVVVDRAKSGATVHERTDFQRMLADARKALFRAVCAETTGRYGRDEEDRAGTPLS
jgi:hypothetical protein